MREIKFKGWLASEKKMFEFDMWIPWEAEDEEGNTWYTKKMEITQFTGLKDKNGKEIYEGDILYLKLEGGQEYLGSIRYDNNSWGFAISNGLVLSSFSPKDFAIKGNIYENPELLEKEE